MLTEDDCEKTNQFRKDHEKINRRDVMESVSHHGDKEK